MVDPTPIRYRAFLSYSHRDSKWGRWLHRALERTRVSGDLVGRQTPIGAVPPSLRPIFLDREDYSAGASLSEATRAALEASQFLIVLCSPNAAASRYVNEEIRLFKAMGRGQRILPVIIEGEPGDPVRECFPRALRYRLGPDGGLSEETEEPIAADARDHGDGRDGARMKLVAGLLGLALDEIVRRAERERRRVLRLWIGSLSAIAAILAGLGVWAEINRRRAAEERDVALTQQSRHLAAQAAALVDGGDHATALALALEVLPDRRHGTASRPQEPSATLSLLGALAGLREVRTYRISPGLVTARFSSDGRRILGTSVAKGHGPTMSLWDVESGRLLFASSHRQVDPALGERHLFVHTQDGLTRVDIETGRLSGVLRGNFEQFVASRDGSRVVLIDSSHDALIWKPDEDSTVPVAMSPDYGDGQVQLSSDGRRLVRIVEPRPNIAGSVTVDVWDAATGSHMRTLVFAASSDASGRNLDLSDGGDVLIVPRGGSVEFLGIDGEPRQIVRPGIMRVRSGTFALLSEGRDLQMWDLRTLEPIWTWTSAEPIGLRQVELSDDGRHVIVLDKTGSLTVLDARSGESADASWMPKLRHERSARLWMKDGVLQALTTSGADVSELVIGDEAYRIVGTSGAFSPDGKLFVTTTEAGAIVLSSVNRRYTQPLDYESGAGLPADPRVFSNAGSRLVIDVAGESVLVDARSRRRLRTLGTTSVVRFSPDDRRVVTLAADGVLRVWDALTGDRAGPDINLTDVSSIVGIELAPGAAHLVVLRGDEALVQRAEILELPAGRVISTVKAAQDAGFRHVRVLDDHRLAAYEVDGNETSLLVWDLQRGVQLTRVDSVYDDSDQSFYHPIHSLSPDGTVVVVVDKAGELYVQPLEPGRPRIRLRSLAAGEARLEFSADSRRLIALTSEAIQSWDVATGLPVLPGALPMPRSGSFDIAGVSRTGRRALIYDDGRGWLVADFEGRGHLVSLEGEIEFYKGIGNISAAGDRVVLVTTNTGVASVFDAGTGKVVANIRLAGDLEARSAVFSPDGGGVVIHGRSPNDEQALVWWNEPPLPQLIEAACAVMPRPLTLAQRQRFFLEPSPRKPTCGRPPLP